MTLNDLLGELARQFSDAGIDTAALDARVMLCETLGIQREYLLAHGTQIVPLDDQRLIRARAERRAARQPLSQILGKREFWSLDFQVSPDVLTPRPESETLIDVALSTIVDHLAPISILDMGTGSGCLLLSLLHELPRATGLGVDLSLPALDIARRNAVTLGLAGRARFEMRDWFNGPDQFDLVISNPPYIPTNDITNLDPEVAMFEPSLALDGGSDGLRCYREIAQHLPHLLTSDGVAIMEFGAGQASDIQNIFSKDPIEVIDIKRDLSGCDRVVTVRIKTD